MCDSRHRSFVPGWAAAVLLSALALAAPAQAQVSVSVSGSTAVAEITLPGGLGADLTLTFPSAQNLSASSLGIGASVVNPLDATLLARLR